MQGFSSDPSLTLDFLGRKLSSIADHKNSDTSKAPRNNELA